MNDQQLAAYLGIAGDPIEHVFIARLSPEQRATYERMKTLEEDIKLWQAGVGPKPTGVILCHDHTRKPKVDQPGE
jgi:hypothetical protein